MRTLFFNFLAGGGLLLLTTVGLATDMAGADRFQDLRRQPDSVSVVTEGNRISLKPDGAGRWREGGILVSTLDHGGELQVRLTAPGVPVRNLELGWMAKFPQDWKYLGDAW